MDLGADLTAQLIESRADAESLMLDACTVGRPGETTTDPGTGELVTPLTPLYAGKCKIKAPQRANQPVEVGGGVITITPGAVHVPAGHPTIGVFEEGDVVTVTESDLGPSLVGMSFRITGPFDGTFVTARRYPTDFF